MSKKDLVELLEGYVDPSSTSVAGASVGSTGLTVRTWYICVLEAAYRSLGRSQAYTLGRNHFNPLFHLHMECMRQAWQSEIMRVLDRPRTGRQENLTIPLFHEVFQTESSISDLVKHEERRLFDLLHDRYEKDGYRNFRNKAGFHTDKATALMRPPARGADLHDMTKLILDWYKHVGTSVVGAKPKYVTVAAERHGILMAKQFKDMMLSTLRYQRYGVRALVDGRRRNKKSSS